MQFYGASSFCAREWYHRAYAGWTATSARFFPWTKWQSLFLHTASCLYRVGAYSAFAAMSSFNIACNKESAAA